MDASISVASLKQAFRSAEPPLVIDVRRTERFRESPYLLKGALRRIEAWRENGGDLFKKPENASSRRVTRERPKIDRIACPGLVRRFVDPDAEFLYVPAADVRKVAEEKTAVPYDIPDVAFSHVLKEPALDALATIVRGADTSRPDLSPQSPGLLAISLGLSRNFADDHEMLEHGMVVYDALYAWCKHK